MEEQWNRDQVEPKQTVEDATSSILGKFQGTYILRACGI